MQGDLFGMPAPAPADAPKRSVSSHSPNLRSQLSRQSPGATDPGRSRQWRQPGSSGGRPGAGEGTSPRVRGPPSFRPSFRTDWHRRSTVQLWPRAFRTLTTSSHGWAGRIRLTVGIHWSTEAMSGSMMVRRYSPLTSTIWWIALASGAARPCPAVLPAGPNRPSVLDRVASSPRRLTM